MTAVVMACKAVLAVLLAAAGGAKLADLPQFAAGVRLFLPSRLAPRLAGAAAGWLAVGEVAAGTASLSWPLARWLNLVVLVICAGFVAVAAVGYARYPGRPCRCFGALTRRGFGVAGIGRAVVIAAAAAVATMPVAPALVRLGPTQRLCLLGGALLVASAAYSAAAAMGAGRERGGASGRHEGQRRGGSRPRWA